MPESVEETIDIDAAGNAVSLRTQGAGTVTLVIRGDSAADYKFDVRNRHGTWKNGIGASYTGSADYDDVRSTGADEIRIRCSSGTAGSGDQATITLMANG